MWWTHLRKGAFAAIVWLSLFRLAFLLPSLLFVLFSPFFRLPVFVPRPCIRLWSIPISAYHFLRFSLCFIHFSVFHASRDFSDFRSSKTHRYFDELVETSSPV